VRESKTDPLATLPPGAVSYAPPIGDAALEYKAEAILYLPAANGSRLISITEDVLFFTARPQAESLVRALLIHPGNDTVSSLGGEIQLSLYGVNPVEVSRDVVTVNLAASALQMDHKSYYLICQAITNTLTTLPGIHYVNFLVMDRHIGLDIASTLPAGAFSRSIGVDVGTVYEQLLSQRAGIEENATEKRLSAMVALYFPIVGIEGLLPEVRNITFDSQALTDMAIRLLEELGKGPQQKGYSPPLPLLSELLLEAPSISEASEGGGRFLTLRFDSNLDSMLTAFSLTRAQSMASLCYTLTTFLPGVTGVRAYIGDGLLYNVKLDARSAQIALLFDNAIQRRGDYAAFVMDICTLYLASADGQKLIPVQRAIPYFQTTNPRALLLELAKGPLSSDLTQNALPIMPRGSLKDADILGFSLVGDALVVHCSQAFEQVGRGMDGGQERLLVYGMVNTLCSLNLIHRVCFFVAGDSPADFSGEIYWAGYFYANMGLVQNRQ